MELYDLPLKVPESREEIAALQAERKRVAVERARLTCFWRPRLSGIDIDRLEDPDQWNKIPILTKEELRALSDDQFYNEFCNFDRGDICEYWRSGGVTGRPLFYPRTFEDIRYSMVGFARTFAAAGVSPGSTVHVSFPLGIHPVGHAWPRAGQIMGMGMLWAGAGVSTQSQSQLELIQMLEPTVWMGMSSYGLHLANLADAEGIDLAGSTVKTILCSAEPLSGPKRERLSRMWGADVFDTFGMTEATMLAAEGRKKEGFHIWTDLVFVEVVDPDTHLPVAPGHVGALVVTSLFTNHATPFLRWLTGDMVYYLDEPLDDAGALSVFPRIRHTRRTAGFFKIRGVNIGHSEFEDFIMSNANVSDFKAEAITADDGNDELLISIEVPRGGMPESIAVKLGEQVRSIFEIRPRIDTLTAGSLAKEFETSVKAPRFIDRRN